MVHYPVKQQVAKQAVLTRKKGRKTVTLSPLPKEGKKAVSLVFFKEGKTTDEHKRGPKGWSPDIV